MHVEAAGEDDEHVLVLRAGRQQELAGRQVAPVAAPQELLHVPGLDALEELQAGEQRALVIGVDG